MLIKTHNNINSHTINDSSMQFMSQIFMTPYTNIKHKPTSIKEIEKLMKSLTSQKIHTNTIKFTKNMLSFRKYTLKLCVLKLCPLAPFLIN
jgi:hypothetical protein